MKNDLNETMELISVITKEIIKIIESDDFSNLQNALNERQQSINHLESLGYSKEEYKKAEKEFEINNLQQKLYILIDNKKVELKEKLNDISKNKHVTNRYNHYDLMGSKIFSKKI